MLNLLIEFLNICSYTYIFSTVYMLPNIMACDMQTHILTITTNTAVTNSNVLTYSNYFKLDFLLSQQSTIPQNANSYAKIAFKKE